MDGEHETVESKVNLKLNYELLYCAVLKHEMLNEKLLKEKFDNI